ncbi:MAG: M18 family aminopeptidase [Bacteroides sp.]|nr:M18 family aminopeptidase [Bacteroides sp.]MCM1448376.1 M18 family aminopeptidase [Bacteroides sp.]
MELIEFMNASPVNFWAVETIRKRLETAGYREWNAGEPCPAVKSGDKLFVTKNGSAVFAFHIGRTAMAETGLHIVAAHADSPTFRVKPNAEIRCEGGLIKLNTELYGGAIMSTWMDRPLSLAGRVVVASDCGNITEPKVQLLKIDRPIATIPNLAIHFNRQVNDGVALSKQKDMLPILTASPLGSTLTGKEEKHGVLKALISDELGIDAEDILDFDLYLYDTTPAQNIGLHSELVQSGRLDDLSMVHAGLEALLAEDETPETTKCLAIFDNEETGSHTKQGAGSPFFASLVQRLVAKQSTTDSYFENYAMCIENSFMISADNAHAWHPNYNEKYDPTNHPVMGGGPVIKYNAGQKYLSDAVGASVFIQVCKKAGVPCQTFVNHSDVAGGSTLGNILSESFPVKGVDIGNPIWGMHSARETASMDDHKNCIKVFTEFYRTK